IYFKTLVRRYQNRVYNVAFRILGNSDEAEEVVQETLIKIHENLPKFHPQATFAAWIFRIAHNICVDTIRNRKRSSRGFKLFSFDPQSIGEDDDCDSAPHKITQAADPSPGPMQNLDASEQEQIVVASLKELPDSQRTVLVLHDVEGFSYE